MINKIVKAAQECVGTPFRHQGREVGVGLDCVGVAIHCALGIGAEFIDQQGYSRSPSGHLLESALDAQPCLKLKRIEDIAPGDLLLMRFAKEPQHIAIVTGTASNLCIVHGYENVGKVCEHTLSDLWYKRIIRVYAFVFTNS